MASERAEKWLELYLETGDAKGAVRQVYNCSEKSVPARASQLKAKYQVEISKALTRMMTSDSVRWYTILRGLATDSSSENVKLNAAKDLLDRGGFKPADVVCVEEKPMSRAELQSKVDKLRTEVIESLTPEEVARVMKAIPAESKQIEEAS